MIVLILMLAGPPALADEAPLALRPDQLEVIEAGSPPSVHDEPFVRLSEEQLSPRPRNPAERWTGIGYGAGISVLNQPGYRPALLLTHTFDIEVGWGRVGFRPMLQTLRRGESFFGLEAGMGVSMRLGERSDDPGPLIGLESRVGWSVMGPRVVVGPELGWAAQPDVRVGLGMTFMPAPQDSWQSLGRAQHGIQISLTVRPNGRFPK